MQQNYKLIADGQWHEAQIDAKKIVGSVLPGINRLSNFQFYTDGNAQKSDQFWIDDFKIKKWFICAVCKIL